MTDAKTDLRCPECDGPITAEQLATEGICKRCVQQVKRSVPPPSVAAATGPAEPSDGSEPAPAPPSDGHTGPEPEAATDALGECSVTLVAMHQMAQTCNAKLHLIDGDELANALGNVFDATIAGAVSILDVIWPDWRTDTTEKAG